MSRGKVWKYGDDINSDVIYPGRYTYQILSPADMAAHALEDLDPEFASNIKPGDVIVAGKNFGCGSSREQAAACLKFAGIKAVIAKSFARIFFRNAINLGLPVIQSDKAAETLEKDDTVEIDFDASQIRSSKGTFPFLPLPASVIGILEAGGLLAYTKKILNAHDKQTSAKRSR